MLKRSLFAFGAVAMMAAAHAARAQDATSTTTTTAAVSTTETSTMAQEDMGMGARPVHFGLKAGATIPVGDASDALKTGFHVGGLVGFGMPALPFGVRVEGEWQRLNAKGSDDIHDDVIDGTANAIFQLPTTGINPYIIAGLGVYHQNVSGGGNGSFSSTDFGLNGGAGLKFNLSGFSTFAEARYHYVFSSDNGAGSSNNFQLIPISFGIEF